MIRSALFMVVGVLFAAGSALGAQASNRLLAVKMEEGAASPTVLIQSAEAIGYRYTVYESFDPVRVVVDLPGMATASVAGKVQAGPAPLTELRITGFELAAGTLARIEIVLDATAEYKIVTDDRSFRVVFPKLAATPFGASAQSPAMIKAAAAAGQPSAASPPEKTTVAGQAAKVISNVVVAPGRVLLTTAGEVGRFEHFTLEDPPRLVVDLYGLRPEFTPRAFNLSAGMRQVSVGAYGDKVRFVFDAEGKALPEHVVEKQPGGLAVTWGKSIQVNAATQVPAAVEGAVSPGAVPASSVKKEVVSDRQVTVESLDFINRDGRSYVVAKLSAAANLSPPVQDGNLVRFEIKNATISRSLRRAIDASAFPSAVNSITPYVVTDDSKSAVRIAVELKGNAPFTLVDEGEVVKLVVDDGAYAEAASPEVLSREVLVDGSPAAENGSSAEASEPGEARRPRYTGQKISLVFDNADIRSILQLIGDVGGFNILAGPDVKGEITLRLIDVPWDQALKLISDTMQLKSVTDGNVMQIYTAKGFAEAKQFELQTKIAESKADDEIKTRRVIEINYVNMDSVKNLAKAYDGVAVNVDKSTKKVMLSGVISGVDSLAEAIMAIDRPEQQVTIEARVVEASTDYIKRLGVKWAADYDDGTSFNEHGDITKSKLGLGGEYLIPLPVDGIALAGLASGITFGTMDGNLTVDMRISALQESGEGKIVSTPKVMTLNGQKATISQGTQIPYPTTNENGETTISFKDALLQLDVTPEINPNGSIILDLDISNDTVGKIYQTSNGETPSIEKKNAKSKVLVRSGETIVIGGIYVTTQLDSRSGVPLLMDIPYVGWLFSSNTKRDDRRELLVFITPRLVVAN
ncbi:MAG: type IV pilus secretin PilQ [Desulfuromonadales bacterium]|nr:type IV pilus secretin PilQ [Desulfuromonadales bacterium]